MSSETDFLNDALGQIGAERIDNIDDGSVNANYCQTFYPALRRAALRGHWWNFAEDRAQLAQDVTAPAFEFSFSYSLPASCLRIKEYNGANLDTSNLDLINIIRQFKIEGRKLLTNDGEVKIIFIKDITDPNLWDPLFYQALATQLASKLAMAIPKSAKMSEALLVGAVDILFPEAKAVDGQEGVITAFQVDDLTWGR